MRSRGSIGSAISVVVKVGGSLFDLPDLGQRLRTWLDRFRMLNVLLVPGGGHTADVIRALDARHGLGEETAHWLALRALSLNATVLQALVPGSEVVADWREARALCGRGVLPILDAFRFGQADEDQPGSLPHCWGATSDALAARVAVVARARALVLLKSVTIRDDMSWADAARCGYLDRCFGPTCAQAPRLRVRAVNFRELVSE
jgi:5-(aminomethyl)-3-furanmethanol phosphate kinase